MQLLIRCAKWVFYIYVVKDSQSRQKWRITVVNKRSQHASGVILYTNSPYDTTAIMRSPNGNLTTQFELHQSEQLGDTKFDLKETSGRLTW